MWSKIVSIFAKSAVDVARNRVLNRHTSTGVLLLLSSGISMGFLNEKEVNLIVSLLSGKGIGYLDMWVFGANITCFYLAYRGVKLIVRMSDCYFEDKIRSKWQNNNKDDNNKGNGNNMSCSRY